MSEKAISKVIFKSSASAIPEVWMDATPATAEAEDIMAPKTAMLANGVMTEGTGTGGGGDSNPMASEKQINFIDYDGAIRYSYTAAEFAELEELPANPSHDGRIAQGWNWTLAQINAQLANCPGGVVWVGQQYTTSDGATIIHIVIPHGTASFGLTMYVNFAQSVSNGVTVDWGDGSTAETYSGTSFANHAHTYDQPGEYDIKLTVTDGTVSFGDGEYYCIYGYLYANEYNKNRIIEVEFGNNIANMGNSAVYNTYSLTHVSMPRSINLSGGYTYAYDYALLSITFPDNVTTTLDNTCKCDYALCKVSIPGTSTSIGSYSFEECNRLCGITIPYGVLSINNGAFIRCYGLSRVDIPSTVTSIGDSVFQYCIGLTEVHVRATTPPTLGSSVFSGISSGCVIYVPSSAVNTYKSATNWSAYASQIQAEP